MSNTAQEKNLHNLKLRANRVQGLFEFLTLLILLVLGLNPILTTVIVADDLIGPFSMYVDAGPGLGNYLKAGWDAASYGHFNYIGQLIGAFVNWAWLELMLLGVRFSTIYFFTKLLVFLATVYATSAAMISILGLWNMGMNHRQLRLTTALFMIGTLQLHLVWSNDPVGSYPMSGYTSLAVGLVALRQSALLLAEPDSVRRMISAALSLLFAVLYYEINIALIPAILVLATTYVLTDSVRRGRVVHRIAVLAAVYAAPCLIILELQRRNAAESASYQGTAIELGGSVLSTFGTLSISSLPWSSWHLAFDWILTFPGLSDVALLAGFFLALGVPLYWYHAQGDHQTLQFSVACWLSLTMVTYWLAATGIQALTVKVQNEATRIGSVYNFYAVGSIAVVSILALLTIFIQEKVSRKIIRLVIVILIASMGLSQMYLNHSIQDQHYEMLPQTRNLLVSFSERRPIDERCGSLEAWLGMGWPQYYSNSMTTGMERSYFDRFGEEFCGRF